MCAILCCQAAFKVNEVTPALKLQLLILVVRELVSWLVSQSPFVTVGVASFDRECVNGGKRYL